MKKVLIIGASGSLAKVIINELKVKENITLTLFARNKGSVPQVTGAKVIEGNALSYAAISQAIKGQDVDYGNLAGDLRSMAENFVKAMNELNIELIGVREADSVLKDQ